MSTHFPHNNLIKLLLILLLFVAFALRLHHLVELPPAAHYDEAANGLLAGDIGLREARPIFISSYTGKEPIFFYLAGFLMYGSGQSLFTLRLTSVFISLLTIASTYTLSIHLLKKRQLGFLVACWVALHFWSLIFSRLGFRAITQPLLQALTIIFIWRGIQHNSYPSFALGGFFLGATAYTYLAARLFPLVLILPSLLFLTQSNISRRFRQLLLLLLVASLTLLPLLFYFIENPDSFWVRITQVSSAETDSSIIESYLLSLKIFFWQGDPYSRFNIPKRPLFNPITTILFLIGFIHSLFQLRNNNGTNRATLTLLLTTPFIMILPTALAQGEIIPSNLRAIGLQPFIFFFPAMGLNLIVEKVNNPKLYTYLLFLFIPLFAISSSFLYFYEWGKRVDLFYESDADLGHLAQFLDQNPPPSDTQIYLNALHYRHPTIAFLSETYPKIKWVPEANGLIIPTTQKGLFIYPHNQPIPNWQYKFLEQLPLQQEDGPNGPDNLPLYTFLHYSPTTLIDFIPNKTDLNFGNLITLVGYDMTPSSAGSALSITLFWQINQSTDLSFTPFIHLEDHHGYRWGQIEQNAYPTEQWSSGELFIQNLDIPISWGAPPINQYQLRIGLFSDTARLPRLDNNGRFQGDSALIPIPAISSAPIPTSIPHPPIPQQLSLNENLTFLGHNKIPHDKFQGEAIPLSFWWTAVAPLPPITTTLLLTNSHFMTQTKLIPVHQQFPYSSWTPPTFIIDHNQFLIPPHLPPDTYHLTIRYEDPQTIKHIPLGSLTIHQTDRLFVEPPIETTLFAQFDHINLIGYQLDHSSLTLFWHTTKPVSENYTVFVHLLQPNYACCLWQQDTQPMQGTYPTTRWLEGEYIIDQYSFPHIENISEIPIELGLYQPDTGVRVPVSSSAKTNENALYLQTP